MIVDVLPVLLAEVADRREHRVGRRLAEAAEAGLLDVAAPCCSRRSMSPSSPSPGGDALEDLEHALGAEAAGHALAAALVLGELQEVLGEVDHAGGVVGDHHAAGADRWRRSRRGSRSRRACRAGEAGTQPPEGPPSCTALNFLPSLMPPPTSKMTWRSVEPMGTSARPPLTILPARLKALVPLHVSLPIGSVGGRPVGDDPGHVGARLDVVDVRGLAPEARDRRERRPRARHAALALDGGDERRLLAADERAGAFLDLEREVPAAAERVLAQEAALLGGGDGEREALDRRAGTRRARRCSPRARRWRSCR